MIMSVDLEGINWDTVFDGLDLTNSWEVLTV